MTAFTNAAVRQCNDELARFNNGRGRETESPFFRFVGEYWSVGVGNNNIDGRTTFQDSRGRPFRPAWSSAFISFVMKKAGAGDRFFYSEAHIHYVVKSIRDARENRATAKFLGRDPERHVPKVGDIINGGRAGDRDVRFANVLRRYGPKPAGQGNFISSHSDIVTAVDQQNRTLTTVGGNVEVDTVGEKTWELKANGTLKKGPTLICVIETVL